MSATLAMLASNSSNGVAAFWTVCILGLFAFAWIAGIAEIAGKPEDEFATGTRTTWLLLVIFTGILGLVAYLLAGKKRDRPALATSSGGVHKVHFYSQDGEYFCGTCGFTTVDKAAATAHQESRNQAASIAPAGPPATPGSAVPVIEATPGLKTCPDCAEEVRFAARKCRFCGYMFESADVRR